jgi:hypothetical protein
MDDSVNVTFSRALTMICLVLPEELTPLFPDGVEYTYLI